jgi:hypothetical protein
MATGHDKERADFGSGGQANLANQGRGIGVVRLQRSAAYVSSNLAERRAVYIVQSAVYEQYEELAMQIQG